MLMVENLEKTDNQKENKSKVILLTGDNHHRFFLKSEKLFLVGAEYCPSKIYVTSSLLWRFRDFPFFSINHVTVNILMHRSLCISLFPRDKFLEVVLLGQRVWTF